MPNFLTYGEFFFNFFTTLARILWCIVVNLMHKKSGTLLHRFFIYLIEIVLPLVNFTHCSSPYSVGVELKGESFHTQSHIKNSTMIIL